MTIKEAILRSLEDLQKILTHNEIYEHIIDKNYYNFGDAKTPASTISALLGDFIRKNDQRVKRIKGEKSTYLYYLSKFGNHLKEKLPLAQPMNMTELPEYLEYRDKMLIKLNDIPQSSNLLASDNT